MKIICGLGNPGPDYERNRHNVGFLVLDALAAKLKAPFSGQKFEASVVEATVASHKVVLTKPRTFMNLSGRSLASWARFYKVPPDDVLVVHDELDLPFGRLQLKRGGGTGGHRGLESIVESWGERDFDRLRVGIGRPEGPGARERVVGYVLGDFSNEESAQLPELLQRAADAAGSWVSEGLAKAMNRFNRR